jgi:hypothetical protein
MTFTIVSLHASILVVMRTLQFMALVLEMLHEPFQWVVERHVQDLVFLCDFASVVLRSSPAQHSHSLHMPALYANETFVRMLPWLLTRETLPETSTTALIRTLHDQSVQVSNPWLRRNLARLTTGLRLYVQNNHHVSKTVNHILKERAEAVINWGRTHGMDKVAVFHDPLFTVTPPTLAHTLALAHTPAAALAPALAPALAHTPAAALAAAPAHTPAAALAPTPALAPAPAAALGPISSTESLKTSDDAT